MKIRKQFVSNSSSTSFCIVGVIIDNNEFKGKGRKEIEQELMKNGVGEKHLKKLPILKLVHMLYDYNKKDKHLKALKSLVVENGVGDYIGDKIIGLDITKMKDNETLGEVKTKVLSLLKVLGYTGKLKDIGIIKDGGMDYNAVDDDDEDYDDENEEEVEDEEENRIIVAANAPQESYNDDHPDLETKSYWENHGEYVEIGKNSGGDLSPFEIMNFF